MPLTEQTRSELRAIRQGIRLPDEYTRFMIGWIAFNRAYNELRRDEHETQRVLGVGDDLMLHWPEIVPQAAELLRLECIGSDVVPRRSLLRPNRWVKSASMFLRRSMRLQPAYPFCCVDRTFCRHGKYTICREVELMEWDRTEMAALLRLVYQVRCNLFHGEKRLSLADVQSNHDRRLVNTSMNILNTVFGWLA